VCVCVHVCGFGCSVVRDKQTLYANPRRVNSLVFGIGKTRGVILMQKEELWKLKYFTIQKYNLPLKETKILQGIIITL